MPKRKILLVDDSPTFLKLEETYLQNLEHEVFTAENGKAALDKLAAKRPDLVVMDLIMPEMEGDQVCRLIKSNDLFKETRVIMVTTKGDKKGADRCQKAGCDLFLTKPLRKSVFLGAVKQLLSD